MLRKARTFELPSAHHQPMEFIPKRSASLKFPTSPQLVLGEEMLHFSHPQHALSQVNIPDLFTCAGCKEYGAGKRFTCQQCDYQLHDFCTLAPPALKTHPFHYQHQLVFYSKPVKGGIAQSKCDVCSKPIKGYTFRCGACSFQMHPCCAMLSSEISFMSLHPHTLRLLPASLAHSSASDPSFVCGECRRKRSGSIRVYHCTVCDYHLHTVCAKNIINGLHDNGIRNREKPSLLGTAARLASQVVIEFIGGIIEGLGKVLQKCSFKISQDQEDVMVEEAEVLLLDPTLYDCLMDMQIYMRGLGDHVVYHINSLSLCIRTYIGFLLVCLDVCLL